MKASMSLVLSFLLLSILSLTASAQGDLNSFLQCLPTRVNQSHPIDGAVYTRNDSSFETVFTQYIKQRRFLLPTTPRPLAIVTALHESHVQATVICAKSSGLEIRIRSGGHDYEGLSYRSEVDFVVLDMFNLRSIDIDIANETAWVQAGATLGEVYYNIANKSNVHGFPAGVCPTVGAGGHFTGGGYGTMMRNYGLTVDNIIDALIVNVSGAILNRSSMGEDLFWAIRGGGGASFAVILAWKIKLVSVPSTVTVFKVNRTLEENATDIVYQWQEVAHNLDKELFIRAMPQVVNTSSNSSSNGRTVAVFFYALYLGKSDALLSIMNQSFPKLGLKQQDCIEMSWINHTLFWFDYPIGTPIQELLNRSGGEQTQFYKFKSDYVKQIIPKQDLNRIWRMMIRIGGIWMQWNPYGGVMSEIPKTATPFPHRGPEYLFKIQYATFWDFANDTDLYLRLSREVYDAMTPYVTMDPREAFLNYRDLDIGTNTGTSADFGPKYFKDNFSRLMQVKRMVDPENFFKNQQSIPPQL